MFSSEPSDFEAITPYKIALVAVIKNYAEIVDGRHPTTTRIHWLGDDYSSKRKLSRALLTWINQPDGTLKSILRVLGSCSRSLHSSLCKCLEELCDSDSTQSLDDFFEDLSFHITFPPAESLLQRAGVLGIFCRWMALSYEKLSFSQLRPLHDNLSKYCSALLIQKKPKKPLRCEEQDITFETVATAGDDRSDMFDEMELESQSELDSKSSEESMPGSELKSSDLKTDEKSEDLEVSEVLTSRQADYFFSQQAMLIVDKESLAMSPEKLQNKIGQILKNNPRLTEAHYLSYLNCLRTREFCASVDCLLNFFNRHTKSGTLPADEAGRVCRYAALNLALLHYRFGHKNAAIAAAREAVDLSQLASDSKILQHAMSVISELDPSHVQLSLLSHQVKPAKQMNLTRLAAKAIHRDVNSRALLGNVPSSVFVRLAASEALARSKTVESLSLTSFIHKGALWSMYGKRHMANLYCQLTLAVHWPGHRGHRFYPWQPNSSDVALSLCHLVELLHDFGEIPASQEVLRHLKQRFLRETEHSKLWQLMELRLRHKMALRNCKFSEATLVEQDILPLDRQEAELRKAERLYYSGDNVKAHDVLQNLLKNCLPGDDVLQNCQQAKRCTAELKCQIYLYLGRVLFTESSDSAASLTYLLKALSTAVKYYLHGLAVKSRLLIFQLQMYSNCIHHARRTLDACVHECMTNGSLMEISRLKMIQAQSSLFGKKTRYIEDIDSAIETVLEAKHGFEVLQDLHRQKFAAYYLARLFHEKSLCLSKDPNRIKDSVNEAMTSRNKFSSEFRQMDSLTFTTSLLLI